MNSLIRRVQNRNDISKIHAVLDICYQAGVAHEKLDAVEDSSAYVQGRVRDLVKLLGLVFDNRGNIDCIKSIARRLVNARA